MSEIKACIFDMDGVLVSTEIYHFKAWKRLAATIGIDIDEQFNENLKGVSRAVCIDLILKHGGLEKSQAEKNVLAAQKNEWFLVFSYQFTVIGFQNCSISQIIKSSNHPQINL